MIAVMAINSSVVQDDEAFGRAVRTVVGLSDNRAVAVRVFDFTTEYREALKVLLGEENVQLLEEQETA